MGELFFDDCEVPKESLLAKPGMGMLVFDSSMSWERGCILASTVGTMERQLERSLAYAQERKQFGQPIGSFQAVSHKLVDMKLRLETARLLLYRLGWLIDSGAATPLESALVKLYLSECYVKLEPRRAPGARRLRLHDGVRAGAGRPRRDREPALLRDVGVAIQRGRQEHGLVSEHGCVSRPSDRLGSPPSRPARGRRRRPQPHLRRARRPVEPRRAPARSERRAATETGSGSTSTSRSRASSASTRS